MQDSELSIVVKARDQASSVIKHVQNQVNTSSGSMGKSLASLNNVADKFAGGLVAAGAVATVAAGAVVGFGVSAVKSFMESENTAAQLNAVLKSTNGIAGVTADVANDLASAFQKTTRYSDESILSAENMLLTFTNIGKDVFPATTEAVLDMATAMGTDLKTTAIQVGKALQDPIEGVSSLQRVGVRLTEQQKKQVEAMVKAGDAAGAQAVILKELQTEFGGSAKAAGLTFAGKLDILRNSLDDVKESIGKVIIDAITPLASKIADFVNSDKFQAWLEKATAWLSTELPVAIDYITTTVMPAFKKIFDDAWPVIEKLGKVAKDVFLWLSEHTYVIWGLVAAFTALKLAMAISAAVTAFQASMAILTGTVIPGVVGSLGGMSAAFVAALPVAAVAAGVALIIWELSRIVDTYYDIQRIQAETFAEQQNLNNSIDQMYEKGKMSMQMLYNLQQSSGYTGNNPLYEFNGAIVGGFASGGYTGAGGVNEVAGVVHKGEYVLPKSQVDQGTGQPKASGGMSTINNNIYGNISLGDASAVDRFFERLDRTTRMAKMGITA